VVAFRLLDKLYLNCKAFYLTVLDSLQSKCKRKFFPTLWWIISESLFRKKWTFVNVKVIGVKVIAQAPVFKIFRRHGSETLRIDYDVYQFFIKSFMSLQIKFHELVPSTGSRFCQRLNTATWSVRKNTPSSRLAGFAYVKNSRTRAPSSSRFTGAATGRVNIKS